MRELHFHSPVSLSGLEKDSCLGLVCQYDPYRYNYKHMTTNLLLVYRPNKCRAVYINGNVVVI